MPGRPLDMQLINLSGGARRRLARLLAAFALASCTTALAAGEQGTEAPDSPAAQAPVPHGPIESFDWRALPQFNGSEAIIYRSPDGKRVAAIFRTPGEYTFTFPFDEFMYVVTGSVTITMAGAEPFALKAGEMAYFRQGMTAHFASSADYSNIAMMVSDQPVSW
jgi:uncharacterized cupin superfamily protein